ncbi:Trp biosynthesis-associated membrane protein [Rathayibacter sp. VKM Ac-2929]|uniref:Trp biosynthesis-associated membrane protein n=1 Tax=Rathayibacter sp. VKM Ac-2929 TaxID=2929480 RepID=UPI001FB4EC31|nr:Trp biosynthesis-associated membrane protein [Rathayibacter sp. VKM Ac-2929]MCJ1674324.1 Trp biosynthesis-associated membrane protein [Rathayibacter sp. VKM Ac-2929]
MSGRRLKYSAILGIVLLAALELTASTQPWATLLLTPGVGDGRALSVVGTVAAPALSALALAGLALAAALAIAGPAFRIVLGLLQIVLGGSVVLAASTALADPVRAGSSLVTDATAIAGRESVAALVASSSVTAWPVVALVAGVLTAVIGVLVLVTVRRWPGAKKKRASRFEPADGYGHGATTVQTDDGDIDPVVSWDELSRGDDPTSAR